MIKKYDSGVFITKGQILEQNSQDAKALNVAKARRTISMRF